MSNTRLILAEDNPQVLQYVHEYLSRNHCEILAAVTDGIAAVDAAVQLRPDVLVLDVSMPGCNGIQAASKVRQAKLPVKVVFLTVNKDPDVCRAALDAGACGYVLKSRMASDLMPAIRSALEDRQFISPGCE